MRWIHAHAPDLHVDASRIVVLGSSAGGEVAASALTQGAGRRLARGLIMLSPPVDLALVAQNTMLTRLSGELAENLTRDLINCEPTACAEMAEEYGSPGNYVLGANVAGFIRVAEAMRALGVV